jgi:hypothetical protein
LNNPTKSTEKKKKTKNNFLKKYKYTETKISEKKVKFIGNEEFKQRIKKKRK